MNIYRQRQEALPMLDGFAGLSAIALLKEYGICF